MIRKYELSVLRLRTDGAFQRTFNDFQHLLEEQFGKSVWDTVMADPDTANQINGGLTLVACLHMQQQLSGGWTEMGQAHLMHELVGFVAAKSGIDRYGQILKMEVR